LPYLLWIKFWHIISPAPPKKIFLKFSSIEIWLFNCVEEFFLKLDWWCNKLTFLQAQFAQIRAPGGMAPLPAGIPLYHPGAPRLAPQQLYYGQGTPGFMPPQPAGFSFQQQILPGMRPGVAPNFIMPYHLQRQGQLGQRTGVRRNGNFQQVQQNQVVIP